VIYLITLPSLGPEEGIDMFFRIIGWLSTDYMALYLRRKKSA
jgi:hypothetical protein